MLNRVTRIAACLAVAAAVPLSAAGQVQVEVGPDDWQLNCETGGCLVIKPVPIDEQGRRVMLTFAVPADGGMVRMALLTPLGTALEPGLTLQVGADEQVFRYSTCTIDGCAIVFNMSDDDIANMAVLPSILATFAAVNRDEPYVVTIPMADLAEAIAMARKGGVQ